MPLTCEHLQIDWQLKNLILCSRSKDIYLETPVFELKNLSTWKLEFRREMSGKASCSLSRCDVSDRENVYAHCQFSLRNTKGESRYAEQEILLIYDAEHSTFQIDLGYELLEEVQHFMNEFPMDDIITLHFEILLYYEGKCHMKFATTLSDKECFRNRMLHFLRTEKYADLDLRVKNNTFKVHKAVLFARSSFFHQLLVDDPSMTAIELLDVESDIMGMVLSYLYSGSPSAFIGNFKPFALYECAQRFGIRDLEALLTPKTLKYSSEIIAKRCVYDWCISNFSSLSIIDDVNRLVSPPIRCNITSKEEFRFILCFLGTENSQKNIGTFVEMLEGDSHLQVLFKVSIIDTSNMLYCTQQAISSLGKNKIFGFNTFLKKKYFAEEYYRHLAADTLIVCCTLIFSTSEHVLVSNCSPEVVVQSPVSELEIDFQDFGKLYKQDLFTDVTIIALEKEFRVHRILMSASSEIFEELFDKMEKRNENAFKITEKESSLLSAWVEYINLLWKSRINMQPCYQTL